MLNHLRQKRLPEEAETRGLHALAEGEAAKILGPIKASLDRAMTNKLSEANFHTVNEDRQPKRTLSNWPRPEISQPRQLSTGMSYTMLLASSHINLGTLSSRSEATAATQSAPTVGSPCNAMYSDQLSSGRLQYMRESPHEPSPAQTEVQNRPGLMSRVQTHGLELEYMPMGSISCETHIPHIGNPSVDDSAHFNAERNVQVVSHYSQPSGRRKISFFPSNIPTP